MAFEELCAWEVWAEHDGTRVFEESFGLAYPEDAVGVVVSHVQERLSVQQSEWPPWMFRCIARPEGERLILFGVSPAGRPVRLVEANAAGSRLLADPSEWPVPSPPPDRFF